MSGLIVALTIGFVPILLVYLKKTDLRKNHLFLTLVILSPLILFPAKVQNSLNNENLGFDAQDLYTSPDYNQQSLLWGNHFVESTKGKMLLLSALGSPGYALPMKSLLHNARDFLLQFDYFVSWTAANKVNAHALICGSIGSIILISVILLIRGNKRHFSVLALTIYSVFYVIPFFGLAVISNLHGFNYSLFAAHTIEYSLLLLLPIIVLWETSCSVNSVKKAFLMLVMALPILKIVQSMPLINEDHFISNTEKERGLSSSRFSQAINYIETDSDNNLDIIYFLPSGDMGDLVLRTKMRTMATHFAGGNFPQLSHFKTSKELNIYLAYDEKLSCIPEFTKAISEKFQNSILEKTILKGGVFVQRIRMLQTPSLS